MDTVWPLLLVPPANVLGLSLSCQRKFRSAQAGNREKRVLHMCHSKSCFT